MTGVRAWGWTALLLACSGTDTGNPPVIDLQTSGCRERYGETKAIDGLLQSLAPDITSDPLYDGLTCFVWSRVDDRLTISLTNYETGCHANEGWSPKVEYAKDGALELVAQDSQCTVAGCGRCVYDLTFTMDAEAAARDREVRMYERGCDRSRTWMKVAALPLASQSSGAVCAYTSYEGLLGRSGTPYSRATCFLPPSDAGAATDGGVTTDGGASSDCPARHACTDVGDNVSAGGRCLATCTNDSDCDALSRCEAGVCRLSATGLTTSSRGDAR